MRDVDAAEFARIELVRRTFLDACGEFGFELVEPSPIEMLSVLEAKSGPSVRDEVYHFEDKGGRKVALRFDFTVGMTRAASAERSARLPLRRASFGGVWRYDEPQRGRYRNFHQWDIEIYGARGAEADAEAVEFTSLLLERLGLRGTEIRMSHRRIAESHVRGIFPDANDAAVADMLRAVDRTQKRKRSEIVAEYAEKGYDADSVKAVLRLADARGTADEARSALGGEPGAGWDELGAVLESLERRSVDGVTVDLGIVRGLDYYSGVVFEAFDPDSGIGALAGGGRYDGLPRALGGADIGAAGAAGGVERILLAMDAQKAPFLPAPRRVFVLYAAASSMPHAISVASKLRRLRVSAGVDLSGRPLGKQLSHAAAANAHAVIILGPREEAASTAVVRIMDEERETTVGLEDLLENPAVHLSLQTRS